MKSNSNLFLGLAILIIIVVCFSAWITHIFTCFATAAWGFLIAGAIFFPVGILHGFYLWII